MEAALQSQPISEARRAVDDGYLWPVARPDMVEAKHIRSRMVEDIDAAVHDGGEAACVTLDDLRRLGWTLDQIGDHASIAFAIYKAEGKVAGARGRIVRRDSVPAMAASAVASLMMVVSIGIWAGVATGVL